MEHTFVFLLNEGSYNEAEEFSYSPPPPLSQENSQQAPSKSKRGRSKNFLIEENMLLLSAWLNISMDHVQGNNQTHATYWTRIWKYFHDNKTFESDRTHTSLCNRWSAINTSLSKFIGYYNKISSRNQSGVTEQNKIAETMTMFEDIQKEKFPFMQHWNELRHSPKYAATMARKNKSNIKENQPSSPLVDSLESAYMKSEERKERPIGRKAAKKIKKNCI
ncbi:glutathione S-transferase T3-like [Apium graveolens]|uniref:glutathione S-transferase T3-like n=1 Tax=Apium graveolens TaxID=4045 RepID=UPI003D7A4A91